MKNTLITVLTAWLVLGGMGLPDAAAATTGDAAAGDVRANPADAERKALAAFESMLRAYEGGDTWALRSSLNPAMIGYQRLLDGIATDSNQCKQMRVNLLDTHVQVTQGRAVVQTGWEKRCLLLPNFSPMMSRGRSTVLMRYSSHAWHFASISAGNMFDRLAPEATVALVATPLATPAASARTVTAVNASSAAPITCTMHGRPVNCALVHYAANCKRAGGSVECP